MATQLASIVESSQAERLATGFVFTEGPLWHPDGHWLFVDVRANLIYRLRPGGQPEIGIFCTSSMLSPLRIRQLSCASMSVGSAPVGSSRS